MRCLFTFFAEDVGLLPKACFTTMLDRLREEGRIAVFPDMAGSLWTTMKTGGFSPILMQSVPRFNGGLFEQATALPLTDEQIGLLIDSGRKQWREVEPAIFGTLLERALDKNERHKLGAHFTPRAYVERLVQSLSGSAFRGHTEFPCKLELGLTPRTLHSRRWRYSAKPKWKREGTGVDSGLHRGARDRRSSRNDLLGRLFR